MIGIFDSGIGGLTVARAVRSRFPGHDMIYFGDTARTPYGTKSQQTVVRCCVENTKLLLDKGAKLIVVACNTASALAVDELKSRFAVPFVEVITPAVDLALKDANSRIIGVIGTRATISSRVYETKIHAKAPNKIVHSVACPLLVPLVEEGWAKKPETRRIVKKYLVPLKTRQIDTLILGCTHYPVIKDIIAQKAGKRVRIVDSSLACATALENALTQNPALADELSCNSSMEIFVSDITPQFEKTAGFILGRKISLTRVAL
ncbi:MAG: glutamate racemase [Desulfatibacillaceae bacterium]|nr:glutamate racemase [Desulfatibacillaceae bacterium]